MERDLQHDFIYVQGNTVAFSFLPKSTVALFGQKTEQDEILLHVLCYNASDSRIDIFPDRILVIALEIPFYGVGTRDCQLRVYSADYYMKKLRNRQSWALFSQALAGAINSYNAGRSTSTTTGSITGSSGISSFSATTQTYDPAKQAMVNAENQRRLEQMKGQFELINATTEAVLLKTTTLFPYQAVEGNVVTRYIPARRYRITVPVGDETHVFELVPPQMQ